MGTRSDAIVVHRLAELGQPERDALATEAARALARGEIVALPTDTVYGLFVSAASPEGVARLSALLRGAGVEPLPGHWAWHAPDRAAALAAIRPVHRTHRRMLNAWMPGPVKFRVVRPPEQLDEIRRGLGGVEGTLREDGALGVRVADHAWTNAALAAAMALGHPAIATGLASAGWGDGRALPDPLPALGEAAPALVVDDGPTRRGAPATTVRLDPDGALAVTGVGALEERHVRKPLKRTLLLVCTGNTCRSPMAEAIARHELGPQSADPDQASTRVLSAGVAAAPGEPITPESLTALEQLGIDPVQASRHASREISRGMLAEADLILAMTQAHAAALRGMDPTAAPRILTLDPAGDVPDPLGSPQSVYTATAERLRGLIRRRLAEWGD